jgi:hypothetical protein
VQPFEMGLDDSYVAEAANVSSRPSSPSSGGGESADVAGSPSLHNPTTDEEAQHYPAPCVASPSLPPSHHPHHVKLSGPAPDGCPHRVQDEKPTAQATRREAEGATRTPQQSPSLHPTTTTTPAFKAAVPMTPPSSSGLHPRTPPSELRRYPASAKVTATPPTRQSRTAVPRDVVGPMAVLEAPSPPLSPLPLPLVVADCATLQPQPPAQSSPAAPSPRAPVVLDDEPDVCCICLEEYSEENPMFRGECQHHFHLACLMEWKQRSNWCPMCCAETLHGVGDMTLPQNGKPVDPAEAARQREMAARDEAYALKLQRKYLQRARQQQLQPRNTTLTTRASPPSTPPSRSPQMQPQRNVTPLPLLNAAPPRPNQQASGRPPSAHSGGAPLATATAAAARPTPAAATGNSSSKNHRTRKTSGTTLTQASPTGSRPGSTSPEVHLQFQGGQRPRRRSGQGGCTTM